MSNPIQKANQLATNSPLITDGFNAAKSAATQAALGKLSSLPIASDENLQKLQKAIELYEKAVEAKKLAELSEDQLEKKLKETAVEFANKEASARLAKLGSKYLPKLLSPDLFGRVALSISIYNKVKEFRKKRAERSKQEIEKSGELYSYKMKLSTISTTVLSAKLPQVPLMIPGSDKINKKISSLNNQITELKSKPQTRFSEAQIKLKENLLNNLKNLNT